MTKKPLRTEIVLTDAEQDMIDFIVDSGIPRATLFKTAMRAYMQRKEEEQFDERVKRLLTEVIKTSGVQPNVITDVKPKKTLGFAAKRVSEDIE